MSVAYYPPAVTSLLIWIAQDSFIAIQLFSSASFSQTHHMAQFHKAMV